MGFFPKSRGRIRRQASDWVVRLAENATADEQASFERWRDADPRHAEAYDRIVSIWNQSAKLAPLQAVDAIGRGQRLERPGALRLAMAASLVAAILVSVLLVGSRWLAGSAPAQEPMVLAAALGEIREVGLPDGSRLMLDSASRIEAAFTETERNLTLLEGRARFQVAHETRQFAVRAGSREVIATGTLFDVSLIGGNTTVVLLEGSVEVRAVGRPQGRGTKIEHLKPGQKLIFPASAPAVRRSATSGEKNWPSRMLQFDDTRLDEAAVLANRYSVMKLRLETERIRGLRVSGAFRAGDATGFARSLAAAFDLRLVTLSDGNLLLADAKPGAIRPAQ